MRKPKTLRVPRTRAGGEWTEAAFWAFIRSLLRQGSFRYPPIVRHALKAAEEPYTPPKGAKKTRRKFVYKCACCGNKYFRDQVHVDHIKPCGSLRSFEELAIFAERLFCESDGLQVLCIDCHLAKRPKKKGSS